MAPRLPDYAVKKAGREGAGNLSLAKKSYATVLQPFHQTHLGRLPPEIRELVINGTVLKPFHQTRLGRLPPELREQVFIELLATPPPYAGHDLLINSTRPKTSPKVPQKFVHIKASWYHVTRTCRQIYLEAHPLFFASKAYFLASAEESRFFLKIRYPLLPFRYDTITALCLKDLVESGAMYSQERLDEIFSNPTTLPARYPNRQFFEAQRYTLIRADIYCPLRYLRNLQTLGLCFSVGEELEHIDFLYGLTKLTRGVVEFLDAHHWMIRPQDAEDVWKIQYAGFLNAGRKLNKDGETIPFNIWNDQRNIADIDSRAPGLREGDKRYVDVQLPRPTKQRCWFGYETEINWDSKKYGHDDVEQQVLLEAQPEIPQDQTEGIEAIDTTVLAEISEEEISMAELEPESNQNDQSSVLELQREASNDLPPESGTDEGENHATANPTSEEITGIRPKNQSILQAEDPPSSRSLVSETHNAPSASEIDGVFLLDADEDDRVQTGIESKSQAPEIVNLQKDDEFYGDSATEADQPQSTIKEKANGRARRTRLKQAFSQKKQPLLEILVTPSPYTEEEMESFENGQQLAISGKQASSFGKTQGQNSKESGVASQTATPEENHSSPASSSRPGLPSNSVHIGGALILFLLLVILSLPPERLSPPHQERKDSYQQ